MTTLTTTTSTLSFDCPECAGSAPLNSDVMLHEIVLCGQCAAELEILGLDPVRVELAPEIEEDWGE